MSSSLRLSLVSLSLCPGSQAGHRRPPRSARDHLRNPAHGPGPPGGGALLGRPDTAAAPGSHGHSGRQYSVRVGARGWTSHWQMPRTGPGAAAAAPTPGPVSLARARACMCVYHCTFVFVASLPLSQPPWARVFHAAAARRVWATATVHGLGALPTVTLAPVLLQNSIRVRGFSESAAHARSSARAHHESPSRAGRRLRASRRGPWLVTPSPGRTEAAPKLGGGVCHCECLVCVCMLVCGVWALPGVASVCHGVRRVCVCVSLCGVWALPGGTGGSRRLGRPATRTMGDSDRRTHGRCALVAAK